MKTTKVIERIKIEDKFYSKANGLRIEFDKIFSNPKRSSPERFIWDYWNVKDQYTLLRTPAWELFSKKLYEDFHTHLVKWGRENLGCHDVSPTWLSSYVEGCNMNWHCDAPHGPWAFVYSLSNWDLRKYTGGRTLLLKDSVLDFWNQKNPGRGFESKHLYDAIEPRFNRLTVFDPRIPHSVEKVLGCNDVLDSRLVIHGWFVNPRPFIQGSVSEIELMEKIELLNPTFEKMFSTIENMNGALSCKFEVSKDGSISQVQVLSDSLRAPNLSTQMKKNSHKILEKGILKLKFSKQKQNSVITLPVLVGE